MLECSLPLRLAAAERAVKARFVAIDERRIAGGGEAHHAVSVVQALGDGAQIDADLVERRRRRRRRVVANGLAARAPAVEEPRVQLEPRIECDELRLAL